MEMILAVIAGVVLGLLMVVGFSVAAVLGDELLGRLFYR